MGTVFKRRVKYGGTDVNGDNIKVMFKGEERQLNSVLAELAIEYVDELPTEVQEKIYGVEHSVSISKTYNTYADDIIGDYFHLVGSRYEVNDDTTVSHNGKNITYFVVGPTSYTADNGDVFSFLNKYEFVALYEEVHTDYYIGDVTASKYTQLADMEESRREFVSKLEKGTAGGVATLDVNGMIPLSQMPTESQLYIGEWDASTGTAPTAPSRSGVYYNISKEGTIAGVHYNINDWIIWDGTKWNKQVQTADVSSVDGRKGAVNLEDKYAQLGEANTFTDVNTFNGGIVSDDDIILNDHDINNVSYVRTNNVQTASGNTLYLGDEDGADVTIGSNDEEYSNTTNIRGRTIKFESDNPIEGITNVEEKLYTSGDFLTIINNLPASKNRTYFLRMHGTFTNSPLGAGATDVDFHVVVYKIDDTNYLRVIAYDVRNRDNIFTNTKIAGSWSGWVRLANAGNIPTSLSQLNNNIQAVTGSWDGSVLRLYTH